MSAAGDATGTTLQNFRLIERVSGSVWRAEDIRNGKVVAVKILSKGLPKDPAKREALVREVRLSAALYHSFLVGIQEVVAVGDTLLLVMEWVQGQPIAERAQAKPVHRTEFFRIGYQVLDALKLLHAKNIVHGNIAGDSILLLPTGQAKLAGLNLSNILARQGQPSQYQQKGNNVRAVAYMAPEQITNHPVTAQTDIFSLGVVMYEMVTGRPPYQAATAADLAHKIVEEQPPSPKAVNPNIDNAVLSVLGGCLFKDSFKRFRDAKAALDALMKADPTAAKFATDVAKAAAAPPPGTQPAQGRNAILYVADIENYDEWMRADPATATNAAARMQQILGEAVYLFDGKVLESLGPRMVAELPSVESAIEAARKGEFDFSPAQQGDVVVPVRMLLHAGEIQIRDSSVGGPALESAAAALPMLPALTLHVSEAFMKVGKAPVRFRNAGAYGGVRVSTIVAGEREYEPAPVDATAEREAADAAAAAEAEAAALAAKKRQRVTIALAAMVLIAAAGLVAVLVRSRAAPDPGDSPAAAAPVAATPAQRRVFLSVTSADPTLAERAAAIQTVSLDILRTSPEIHLADASGPDVTSIAAQIRPGAAGPEMALGNSVAAAIPDIATAVQALLQQVSAQMHATVRGAASAEAYNAFADALAAQAASDVAKTESALRAATKADPDFLAAQKMAMSFFTAQNKTADAVDAAKHVLAAEAENVDAARMVARSALASGDLNTAFQGYAVLLRNNPKDTEALNAVGKYAVAVNDGTKLNAVLGRLAATPTAAEVHEPDLLMAGGRIDAAIQKYYEVEEKVPNNPALSLKIGRIAVLRHSSPIAELELKKLQESDPLYGVHILKSYLAAQSGKKSEADDELKSALTASTPGDDYWTSAAEVAAIGGNVDGALVALERAAQRKEPTVAYVLNNPLFAFLGNDSRFQKVREALLAQQTEIRTALAAVSL